jgi:hypothetical protein
MAIPLQYSPEEMAAFNAARDKLRAEEAAGAPGTYNAPGEGPVPVAAKGNYFDKYDEPTVPAPPPEPAGPGKNYFDKYDEPKKTLGDYLQAGTVRAAKDFGSIVTGGIKAGQSLLGMPGDVDAFLKGIGAPPIFGGGHYPTTEELGNIVSNATGTSLVKPSTVEGQFLEPMTQGAVSMLSGNPLVAGVGAAAGGTGELASRFLDMGTGGDKSVPRSLGEFAVIAPFAAASAFRPGNVRALQPVLKTLGPTKEAVLAAIDRAANRADVAASSLSMPYTSLWSQIPELAPEVKSLRGTLAGFPLNEQAALEAEAVQREITPKVYRSMTPQWSDTFGYTDPKTAVGNIVNAAKETAAERTSNLFTDLKNNIVGKIVGMINPLDWPRKGGEAISGAVSRGNIEDLVSSLVSPGAASGLKAIVNYSPGVNFAKMLAKSLLRMQGMSGPPASPMIGGNQLQ